LNPTKFHYGWLLVRFDDEGNIVDMRRKTGFPTQKFAAADIQVVLDTTISKHYSALPEEGQLA